MDLLETDHLEKDRLEKKKKKDKFEWASLCQKFLKDIDDFFFILLTRIIARSVARFYLPSCPINISIYVFLPHATLKGTSVFLEEMNWSQCAQIVCII